MPLGCGVVGLGLGVVFSVPLELGFGVVGLGIAVVFSVPLELGLGVVGLGIAVVNRPFLPDISLQTVLPFTIVETALTIG